MLAVSCNFSHRTRAISFFQEYSLFFLVARVRSNLLFVFPDFYLYETKSYADPGPWNSESDESSTLHFVCKQSYSFRAKPSDDSDGLDLKTTAMLKPNFNSVTLRLFYCGPQKPTLL